ncbi:aldehyde dehydrogenase family protein [Agrobacterium sp. CR_3]|uniref:aldehyde dehydrogenase family protein n=1 Tax=unclassified Agrobacterium TaxID=2632611 RepID=UPI0035BF4759
MACLPRSGRGPGSLVRVAHALEAGSVFINDWARVYDGTEEGGFKQSGLGRLNGKSRH